MVAPRVEERYDLAGNRIDAGQVGSLTQVAAMAGKRQVVGVVAPAMLPRDDMLDVMGDSAVGLVEAAILTTAGRSLPNMVARGGIQC